MLTLQSKKKIVEETVEKIHKSASIVIAQSHGGDVTAMNKLRKLAREKDVLLKVIRKNLLKIAIKDTSYQDLDKHLAKSNLVAFSLAYPSTGARILQDFQKKNPDLKIKAASFEGKLILGKEVNLLAALPTYKEAICKLLIVWKELAGGRLLRFLLYIKGNKKNLS